MAAYGGRGLFRFRKKSVVESDWTRGAADPPLGNFFGWVFLSRISKFRGRGLSCGVEGVSGAGGSGVNKNCREKEDNLGKGEKLKPALEFQKGASVLQCSGRLLHRL